MVTRLGIALSAMFLMISAGLPPRAGQRVTLSSAANSPQQARVTPIPTEPQAAKLLRKVDPEYPPEAKKKGIQGTVRLRALIGEDGHVKELRAVSGAPILVKAAEAAVRQWVYKPTLLNGKPVEVETIVTVVFSLTEHKKGKENHA